MKVHVELYSQLRDLAGAAELNIDLPADATVADLLEKVYKKAPSLAFPRQKYPGRRRRRVRRS